MKWDDVCRSAVLRLCRVPAEKLCALRRPANSEAGQRGVRRMTTVGGGVKGLVARAQREAQRRSESPSTGYLLLVMLQANGAAGRLLTELGVREGDLLTTIRQVDAESSSALERAVERAYRIAKAMGEDQVLPTHLLFAMARDSRASGPRAV